MDVIAIFDLYGYGGHAQLADVVAVPDGMLDSAAFDAWAMSRARELGRKTCEVANAHGFVSTTLKTIRESKVPAKPSMSPGGPSKEVVDSFLRENETPYAQYKRERGLD